MLVPSRSLIGWGLLLASVAFSTGRLDSIVYSQEIFREPGINPVQPTSPATTPPSAGAEEGLFSSSERKEPSEAFDASDPFAGSWSDIASSLREPVNFESLPAEELSKELDKLRVMRLGALRTHLVVLESSLESASKERLSLLERIALTTIELSELEMEKAASTGDKLVHIRRANAALRNWERACVDRNESDSIDASKSLTAVSLRLKWEERLVQELIKQKAKSSTSIPTTSTRTSIVEPYNGTLFYPSQPANYDPQSRSTPSRTYRPR
jgi:hypothetical protein